MSVSAEAMFDRVGAPDDEEPAGDAPRTMSFDQMASTLAEQGPPTAEPVTEGEEPAEPAAGAPPAGPRTMSIEQMFEATEQAPPTGAEKAMTKVKEVAKTAYGAAKEALPGIIAGAKERLSESAKSIKGGGLPPEPAGGPARNPWAPFSPKPGYIESVAGQVGTKAQSATIGIMGSMLTNPETGEIDPYRTMTEGPSILGKSVAKALVSGGVATGEFFASKLAGLAAFLPRNMDPEVYNVMADPGYLKELEKTSGVDRVVELQEKTQAAFEKMNEAASAISNFNLAPENMTDAAAQELLAVLPEGIGIAGVEAYERMKEPDKPVWVQRMAEFAGSSIEAIGNVGLLASPKGARIMEVMTTRSKSPAARAMEQQTINLAARDPIAAQALVDHIKKSNPAVAQGMQEIVDRAPKMKPAELQAVGAEIAKRDIEAARQARLAEAKESTASMLEERNQARARELPIAGEARRKQAETVEPMAWETASREPPTAEATASAAITSKGKPEPVTPKGAKAEVPKATEPVAKPAAAPVVKPAIDLTGMGAGIGAKLRDQLFEAWGKGGTKMSGVTDPVLVAAAKENLPRDATRAEFNIFLRGYEERLAATGKPATTAPKAAPVEPVPAEVSAANVSKSLEDLSQILETSELLPPPPKPGTIWDTLPAESRALPTNKAAPEIHQAGFPGAEIIQGEIAAWWGEAVRALAPESTAKAAELAGSKMAQELSWQSHVELAGLNRTKSNSNFWDRNLDKVSNFMLNLARPFTDPKLQALAVEYRRRTNETAVRDRALGAKYDGAENFLPHAFKDREAVVNWLDDNYKNAKGTPTWNDATFLSRHMFEMYEAAVRAGHKPKTLNPEELMLKREHMSNVAESKVRLFKELQKVGLARPRSSGDPRPTGHAWEGAKKWTDPTGQSYWVNNKANNILHNVFKTTSLWELESGWGKLFKGSMWLKNTIVGPALSISGFHLLHVAHIDMATGMKRGWVEYVAQGKYVTGLPKLVGKEIASVLYAELIKETAQMGAHALGSGLGIKALQIKRIQDAHASGHRLLRVFQGKIDPKDLTPHDRASLRIMIEGGLTPQMPSVYKNNAIHKFKEAARQGRYMGAGVRLPFAVLEMLQVPLFEHWIPSMKIASYLKDASLAMKLDPRMAANPAERAVRLRRLAKSADNRYGEMAYNTLFWPKWFKDFSVMMTLSLGWQMGFVREYGGGIIDFGKALRTPFDKAQRGRIASSGLGDRPAFVAFYTGMSLAYSGMMTYMMTGEMPEGLDWSYPRVGEENADGTPKRAATMFYAKEFVAAHSHMKHEGVIEGMGHIAANKASGVVDTVRMALTGVNSMNQEIRDPKATWDEKTIQTLGAIVEEKLTPITIKAIRTGQPVGRSILGFSDAPKYITRSPTDLAIRHVYEKYYSSKLQPYERAELSNEKRELRKFSDEGDTEAYDAQLDKMVKKFDLTDKEVQKLEANVESEDDPLVTMFQRMTWQQQERLLDKMPEEEREYFVEFANIEHLRNEYEPPEDRESDEDEEEED